MHYRELFQLNPIKTVIELEDANARATALLLVERFVVTPSLQDMLQRVALPQLGKAEGVEGKGIFVVGHYGTGKSHVMSFLSALAEHGDAPEHLRPHPELTPARYQAFAGQYVVKRTQLAGMKRSLYWGVAHQLTELATSLGVPFTFKDEHDIVNPKPELERFLTAIEQATGKGVMLVIDELLHYLESRNDQDLVIDLQILQALGEFCDGHRFVFMAGLQRTLFQHPRFHGIAGEVSKVRKRFNDFLIDNKGVAQLIESYLFAKTAEQQATIRRLLLAHKDLFDTIGPDIDRMVALFPAHPLFIDEFQSVAVVERREILTVLSVEAARLAECEVDTGRPQLITSDLYWQHVATDAGLDANHAVQLVKHNAQVLGSKIAEAPLTTDEKAVALRLVGALAVNRLTTPNISDPVGLTPEALKNRLLPWLPLPLRDGKLLTGAIKRLLDKTREAASGQFLALTPDGQQFYIDPHLTRDFDQDVRNDAKTTARNVVQGYFNQLILQQLQLENPHPTGGGTLWQYRLLWKETGVERPGWLFFGSPSQRSTAKPPKDFYLFFLPCPRITGDQEPDALLPPADEVYFIADGFPTARREVDEALQGQTEEGFLDQLWLYAAACERAKLFKKEMDAYEKLQGIANRNLTKLNEALHQNLGQWLRVRHAGLTKPLNDWLKERLPGEVRAPFLNKFASLAADLLAAHFADIYPGYPQFGVRIAEPDDQGRGGRVGAAQSALEMICEQGAGVTGTSEGRAVLKALGLVPAGIDQPKPSDIDPAGSPWLAQIRERLSQLDANQFINGGDLFEQRNLRWFMVGGVLEAEWLQVVLAAGVRAGYLLLYGDGNRYYDASSLGRLYAEARDFKQVSKIRATVDFPLDKWSKLFRTLGLNVGQLANDATRDAAAKLLFDEVEKRSRAILALRQRLGQPLPMTSGVQLPPSLDLAPVEAADKTLSDLKVYTNRAKMLTLRLSMADIDAFAEQLKAVAALQALADFVTEHGQRLAAVERLRAMLQNRAAEFENCAEDLAHRLLGGYANPASFLSDSDELAGVLRKAAQLGCRDYKAAHRRRRLTREQDKQKQALIGSREWKQVSGLTGLRLLEGGNVFDQLAGAVEKLKLFADYTDEALLATPTTQAPHDPFDPRGEPLQAASDELERHAVTVHTLLDEWIGRLLAELQDPSVQESKKALKPEEFTVVDQFEASRRLPDPGRDLELLVQVLNTLLEGLKKIDVRASELAAALLDPKSPLKVSEVQARFRAWLSAQVGHDSESRVRLALQADAPQVEAPAAHS